jgi:homoserine dehydrogenase
MHVKRVALIQVGYGVVGGAVISQVLEQRATWRERLGIDVRIAAIAGRDGAVAIESAGEIDETSLRGISRKGKTRPQALGIPLTDILSRIGDADAVIVSDAAAGEGTTDFIVQALAQGGGAVLSNKAPLSLPFSDPRTPKLWNEAITGGRLRYEATCGAGLPVISTLRTLLDTGDEVIEITGALSGTLGAIFSDVAERKPFSEAVERAKDLGYTEPDPRDDLSGLDVARKALILARTTGRQVDLDAVAVQSLVPEHLLRVDIPTFMDRLDSSDAEIAGMASEAAAHRSSLKYLALLGEDGSISVGLRAIPRSTVMGALQGPENIVSFRTQRYDDYPSVISGPGAGAEVTAAGMLGDVLDLAREMC